MKYLLLLLAFISFELFGQSEPVTQLINEDGSKMYAPKIRVPHSQTTKISSIEARLETENDNALKNPSFESPVIETLGTLGWSSNANKSFSTDAVDGKQAIVIKGNIGLSRMPKIMSTMIAINGATLANQIIIGKAWYKGAGLNNSSICILPTDGSGPVDADKVCTEFGDSNGLWITRIASLRVKSTYIGYYIILGSYTVSSNSETFDKAYASVYDPKDQATILGFKNDSKLESCGLIAADFQGMGTPTSIDDIYCARDGQFLVMEGRFTVGVLTSAQVRINLKHKGQSLTVSNAPVNRSVGLFFAQASGTSNGGSVLAGNGNNFITFSRFQVFGPVDGAPLVNTIGTDFTASSTPVSFNARIPIAEWSENTNGALITCKEGPLKCANRFNFIYNGTNATDQFGNVYTVTKSETSNRAKEINVSSLGLSNPLRCVSANSAGNANVGITQTGILNTNTAVYVQTFTYTGGNADYNFSVDCTKSGSDYNAGYEKVLGFTEDADIRSTEWLTGGFDYIDNKPIYKRCHKVVSDVSAAATLATWSMNLNPKGNVINNYTNNWVIVNTSEGSAFTTVYYERNTGNLKVNMVGGTKLGANSTICMDYVK